MSYQGAMSHGNVTANDPRVHNAAGNSADGDFPSGRCIEVTSLGSMDYVPLRDIPTLAIGDEINYIFSIKLVAWGPGLTVTVATIADDLIGPTLGSHRCVMEIDNVRQAYLRITSGGSDTVSSGLTTLATDTYYLLRIRWKRTGTSTSEAQLYYWDGAGWTSFAAAITHSAWTSNPLVAVATGLIGGFGKGGYATLRYGHKIVCLNETPSATARMYWLLPDGDGGTLQWTLSTGTSHFAVLDEAFGAASGDYAESGTAAGEKRDDITIAAFPASMASSIIGCCLSVHTLGGTPGTGQYQYAIRDNGTDGTFVDPYTWDAGSLSRVCWYGTKAGGGAWSESDVNTAEIVLKRLAASTSNWRVDTLALGVLYEPITATDEARSAPVMMSAGGMGVV